jgi:biopolymer transport protein ExbD
MYGIREKDIICFLAIMFGFLFKIMVCILVVFCIHTIWQKIQEHCVRPKVKNTNAEIEKYKSLVESISQQNKSFSQLREEEPETQCKLPKPKLEERPNNTPEQTVLHDIESDLNSFLDSILIENHIEIMPVI